MDHRHAYRQVPRLARLVVLKPVTGLHPAHSTVAREMLSPVRCAALRGMPAWERRRRIFSDYGSLSSSLRRRLPSYSLAVERFWGNDIALSGKMKRAATGVVSTQFFHPSHLAKPVFRRSLHPSLRRCRWVARRRRAVFPQPLLMRANAIYLIVGQIVSNG